MSLAKALSAVTFPSRNRFRNHSLAFPVVLDLQKLGGHRLLCGLLPEDFRSIDVLINSAGHDLGGIAKFEAGSTKVLAGIIETNVQGLSTNHVVLQGMPLWRRGHIINIGSDLTATTGSAHCAGAAVHAFSITWAELAGSSTGRDYAWSYA